MGEISVEKLRDRPKKGEVESTRRCNQRKGDTSCSLWRDSFEKEQNPVYRKVHQDQRLRRVADLSGTIMHTPITEELLVETPEEANVARGTAQRLRRAMEELRWTEAGFQVHQENVPSAQKVLHAVPFASVIFDWITVAVVVCAGNIFKPQLQPRPSGELIDSYSHSRASAEN